MSDRTPNQRQSRSEATQDALIHAAIALIAENGLENISIRSIIEASGQKNESALQYHFKNRDGLIKAIHKRHSSKIDIKAFGREVVFSEIPAVQFLNQNVKTSSNVDQFIRQSLSDLSKDALKTRLDSAVRFSSMSMSLHARSKNAFQG